MYRTVVTIVISLFMAAPAVAAGPTLRSPGTPVVWAGSVTSGAGPTGEVPECAAGCHRVDVTLNLPAGIWTNKPGGVQFALRWSGHTLGDNVRLYVYRDGALVAKSDGIISIAQSLLLREPSNGTLQIYAAHDPDSPNATIAYEGLAQVEYDPAPNPARRLIPDLVVRSQQNLGFDPGGILRQRLAPVPELLRQRSERRGRPDVPAVRSIFANVGAGPLELRFAVPRESTPPLLSVAQRLHWSDAHTTDRVAGQVEFHASHGHYHYRSFGISRLWRVDAAATRPDRRRFGSGV